MVSAFLALVPFARSAYFLRFLDSDQGAMVRNMFSDTREPEKSQNFRLIG
jgi:hypothetical protein